MNTDTDIQGPAKVTSDHVQDRNVSPVAGAPMAWRRRDGIAYLRKRKLIGRHQEEAATRLQDDYQLSQMQGGARSDGQRIRSSRSGYEIPQAAHDAGERVKDALAVIPAELLSIAILFLLPHTASTGFSIEHIAKRVGEDKRAITLGVRASLSLLARHYGN